jgi:hypothetical protein
MVARLMAVRPMVAQLMVARLMAVPQMVAAARPTIPGCDTLSPMLPSMNRPA